MPRNIIQPLKGIHSAITWMKHEDIMLSKISQHKKKNIVSFYLCEVSRIIILIQKVEQYLPGVRGKKMESCCLMSTQFQYERMKKVLQNFFFFEN